MAAVAGAPVWLLTGDRAGEIAQQRAIGASLGLPVREVKVARMAPMGKQVHFDFSALEPPWPRVAISFGKTLAAALRLRELAGDDVRLVHLGLPRKLPVGALDLIVPMPTDRYIDAPNVLRVSMPFNPAPAAEIEGSRAAEQLRASALPRPWTAVFVGGHSTRSRLEVRDAQNLMRAATAHVAAHGGSLLLSTSPRTPAEVIPVLRKAMPDPALMYVFERGDALNPFAARLRLADELVVTGDSASMIAECWRSGKPVWVWPLRLSPRRRLKRALRAAIPRALVASGHVSADVDTDGWVRRLTRSGELGLLGVRGPSRHYRAEDDHDLRRTVARIRALIQVPAVASPPP